MTQALLLIDIQNNYFIGGAMGLENSEQVMEQVAILLNHFGEPE